MTDDALRETYLSKEELYQGKIIRVERWQVALPNGKTAAREIVVHNGAAAIVPIDSEGNVTLVRQHRIAAGRFTWEIPAGKLDSPAEDPFAAARRELEEETGYVADRYEPLGTVYPSPGYTDEVIHLYLATGLHKTAAHPDEGEFLHVLRCPLSRLVQQALAGELPDAKTQIAILKVWQKMGGK